MNDHEHDRFLYERDGALHFGCINPFCGHGDPALPHHYTVPLDSRDVTMRLVGHSNREITLGLTLKRPTGKIMAGTEVVMISADNFEACYKEFERILNTV